jgi:hypothetical protein
MVNGGQKQGDFLFSSVFGIIITLFGGKKEIKQVMVELPHPLNAS